MIISVHAVTTNTEQNPETDSNTTNILGVACKNLCTHLPGYKKGFYLWHKNGNKCCITCYYQISATTDMIRCPCCKQNYRVSPHFYKQQNRLVKPAY